MTNPNLHSALEKLRPPHAHETLRRTAFTSGECEALWEEISRLQGIIAACPAREYHLGQRAGAADR